MVPFLVPRSSHPERSQKEKHTHPGRLGRYLEAWRAGRDIKTFLWIASLMPSISRQPSSRAGIRSVKDSNQSMAPGNFTQDQ